MSASLALAIRPTELREAIYTQLEGLSTAEVTLDHGYARLGGLLAEFKRIEAWRTLGYGSFDQFMSELHTRFNRQRSQVYAYCGVAEKLLPYVSANDLDNMGISKAQEIKRALSGGTGRKVTEEVLAAALNPKVTIKELRAILAVTFSITDDNRPKGTWFDFDGCFFEPDERKFFVDAVKMTTALLGLKPNVPAHIQRKEIFMAWAAEFTGTHSVEVYGPQVKENADGE